MTYSELNDALAELVAQAREEGRQEERLRASKLAPLTENDLRRLLRHVDPVPELLARLGAEVEHHRLALERLLYTVEHLGGPKDLLAEASIAYARGAAAGRRAGAALRPPAPAGPPRRAGASTLIPDIAIPFLVVAGLLVLALLFAHTAYEIGWYRGRTAQDLLDEALAEQDAKQLLRDPERARRVLNPQPKSNPTRRR